MACWIHTAIIVTNNGTILFGNADILPIVGRDTSKSVAENNAETNTPAGGAAAEGADVASVRRGAKNRPRKRAR
ncbi:hypothetical protein [Paenibacillus sacheonensis]|uniref:Uncharacterized protein n=1 Tax=Paenibacillus sacheonensis TaxID=742054 RepID=A0A7X4YKP8_9BACL|nr:hypothetical protein [Paenibacillus sacheonensis]MBM7564216.1 hypothetical protein [Paenibacillus sacheonensis]NBC67461.1 hypothetical protein [Paenibacillus sacheonensis]